MACPQRPTLAEFISVDGRLYVLCHDWITCGRCRRRKGSLDSPPAAGPVIYLVSLFNWDPMPAEEGELSP